MLASQSEVTRLLVEWSNGREQALEKLMPLVVEELHDTAERYLRKEYQAHTLQPTALVNEVYLRLVDQRQVHWEHRAQFFGFAAQLMRWILVDHARARLSSKRGAGTRALTFEELDASGHAEDEDLVALDEVLKRLAETDERQSRVVELRFFGGLKHEEIAEVLGTSPRTVRREWRTARLWLRHEMRRR